MSLPKPPKKYSDLLDKSFWSVEDLFWILLGDFGFNNVIPIVQGEHQKYYEIEKKIKIAADQGRFGSLIANGEMVEDICCNPIVPWGVLSPQSPTVYYGEAEYKHKMEQLDGEYMIKLKILDLLPTVCIHPMRIIDWIESERESVFSLIGKAQVKGLRKLIQDFKEYRKDDLVASSHSTDWEMFAKTDFWVRTEFRIILFGQTQACRYPSKEYWVFDPDAGKIKGAIDRYIDNAEKLKKIKAYSMKNTEWKPLLAHKEYDEFYDEYDNYSDNGFYLVYTGFYERDEVLLESSLYSPLELLQLAQFKGYPVPGGLIESMEKGKNWNHVPRLVKSLQQNIHRYSSGEKQFNLDSDETNKPGKQKGGTGRPSSPIKVRIIEEARKIIKDKGPRSAPKIARMSQITKILAPNASHGCLVDITDEDYKKRYSTSPRTVEGWVREANKPS
jgi:hypothetical protein